jgi:hypothetical protein
VLALRLLAELDDGSVRIRTETHSLPILPEEKVDAQLAFQACCDQGIF